MKRKVNIYLAKERGLKSLLREEKKKTGTLCYNERKFKEVFPSFIFTPQPINQVFSYAPSLVLWATHIFLNF